MMKLLHTELKKILPYRTFWVITGLFLVLFPLAFNVFGKFRLDGFPIDFTQVYKFPKVWHTVTYTASWFTMLLGIIMVILVCNEYRYKTQRQQVISGVSRGQTVTAKLLLAILFSIVALLYVSATGLGFGYAYTNQPASELVMEQIQFLPAYFLQTLGYMAVAILLGSLIRSSALSIVAYIFLPFCEGILRWPLPDNITPYFPMKTFGNLVPFPYTEQDLFTQVTPMGKALKIPLADLTTPMVSGCVYIVVLSLLSYWVVRKRDL